MIALFLKHYFDVIPHVSTHTLAHLYVNEVSLLYSFNMLFQHCTAIPYALVGEEGWG